MHARLFELSMQVINEFSKAGCILVTFGFRRQLSPTRKLSGHVHTHELNELHVKVSPMPMRILMQHVHNVQKQLYVRECVLLHYAAAHGTIDVQFLPAMECRAHTLPSVTHAYISQLCNTTVCT